MNTKLTKLTTIMILLLTMFLLIDTQTFAQEAAPVPRPSDEITIEEGSRVIPDLGPQIEGLVAGISGYKVYHTGAIESRLAQPLNTNGHVTTLSSLYRAGYTDIWETGGSSSQTVHGSHNSESDLYEDTIDIDGRVKENGQGWSDYCGSPSSGTFNGCNTSMSDPNPHWDYNDFTAASDHYFHTSGYNDEQFNTQDVLNDH